MLCTTKTNNTAILTIVKNLEWAYYHQSLYDTSESIQCMPSKTMNLFGCRSPPVRLKCLARNETNLGEGRS